MPPMFDAREFRRRLAAFATGVAIVTTTDSNGLRARAWRNSRRGALTLHRYDVWRVLIWIALGWFVLGALLLGYRGEHL
jgi:hypothetical protein